MNSNLYLSVPEITELLGSRRDHYHPGELLDDEGFPLNRPEPNPQNKHEAWGRRNLSEMTHRIGEAWEEYLSENYNMRIVDEGPIDLRVTEGFFEGVPVQAKNSCIINSRGYYEDGRAKSSPGLVFMKENQMRRLADFDFTEFPEIEERFYRQPGLVHASVHYPLEKMPELPEETVVKTINHPARDYSVETAFIGEIVIPAKPLYENNKNRFGNGDRGAWPLKWTELFGSYSEEPEYMKYWTEA